jgi:Ca2+-binding RTX toxin-like protein
MRRALGIAAVLLACTCSSAIAGAAPAAATPTCAEGPQRVGDTIEGTPCADTIVAPPTVARVSGGGGADTIVSPVAAALPCEGTCLSVGSQTFEGGPGDDVVFGERGNDILRGGPGNDRLYGGIGDDLLEGGPGNDLLAGGFGADTIDGQEGDDYVRGDGTIDHIHDTGGGNDTLSYASGIAPGFDGIDTGASGFPGTGAESGERGVYLDLSSGGLNGSDGIAGEGGGVDEVEPGAFETIIGTPFPDYIVGGDAGETIYGGGGADVIRGDGGDDHIFGGANGDLLDGGTGSDTIDGEAGTDNCLSAATATSCEGTASAVAPRNGAQVSVGAMTPGASGPTQLYVAGSSGADTVTATYAPGAVAISLSGASFEPEPADPNFPAYPQQVSGCELLSATAASCPVGFLDSIVLAGFGGDDRLAASGFPQATGVVLLGGEGVDSLTGGEGSEDLLVDGRGSSGDTLEALGRDDTLLHEGGPDTLLGGDGNDLFLSTSICDDETIDGGEGRDNSSWARLGDGKANREGVDVRLDRSPALAGRFGDAGEPGCGGETPDTLLGIEDLEGSEQADLLVGGSGENQLLGHRGPDEYFAGAGPDTILANSADSDPVIDCGADRDTAVIDVPTPSYADATPVECETVRQGTPEEFRTITEELQLQPPVSPPPPPTKPKPPVDRKPPLTKLGFHPRARLTTGGRTRRVSFRFSSNEAGSSFRCRIDRRPQRPCKSPRAYTVGLGRHSFRVAAADPAGNVDRTPAVFRFRLLRRR